MDSQAVAMETQVATNQISISNTMTLDASQIDGNSIIAIDNDGNRIPIIIAPSDSKENGEIKISDGESVPVVYVENSEDKQGDEEVTENEYEAIVVEQGSDQDLSNIQFNVYKTDNNSLVIQIPNDSIAGTQIEEQVIEESVQTTIDDIKVAAMSTTCECDICGEYFTNLKDHLTRHPDIETLYSCDTCGKLFSSSDRLTIHLNIHAGNIEDEVMTVEKDEEPVSTKVGDFVCDICHKTFTLSKYLQAHKLVHSEDKRYHCSMCDKKFSQKRYLKAHELLHKGIKPFNCNKCPKTFTNVTALKAHLNGHLGLKPYKCSVCPKAFYRQSNLSAHTKRHLDQPVKVDYDNKFRCECNLSFMNEEELQAHVGMHTGTEPFKCNYCTAEYRLLCKLQDHAKMHMGSEKSYECQICGRAYRHKNSLRSHLASHAQEKLWKCNICDKRFSLLGNLRTHEKLHTGLKPFKCELCSKSFARIDHMRQHRKVHDGIRPYKCDICNKAFSRSHHYQAHINNIHNETKPHECQICHKRFGYISNLRTHEKIHYFNKDHQKVFNKCRACGQMITFIQTGTTVLQKKEFKCEDCGELYHCAQSLTIHQNGHKGEIPFRCNYCGKQFTNNKNLNKHLKIHSGARAYVCDICDKTFIFGHHLKRHMTTHTNQSGTKIQIKLEEDEEDMENEFNGSGEIVDLQTEEEVKKSDIKDGVDSAGTDDGSTDTSNKSVNNKGLETGSKSDKISKTKFTDVICLKPKTDMPEVTNDDSCQDENDDLNVNKSEVKTRNSKRRSQNDTISRKKGQNDDLNLNSENSKSSKHGQKDDKKAGNSKIVLNPEKKRESEKKVKGSQKSEVRANISKKDQIECDTCGKTFDNVSNVKRHKYAVHKKQTQSEETAKKKNLKENENDKEEVIDSEELPEGDGPHKCHICKKKFSCLGYLMQHLAKHAGDKPFQCDVCGKGFAMSTYLRKHRASHTSSKGTQATPPNSPDKSEISATQSPETKPKFSLSTMQTRKRKLTITPDKNNDVMGRNKSSISKNGTQSTETQNTECHICGLKVSASRYLKQHLKIHEKEDDSGTPKKKSKTQNVEKEDDLTTPNKKSKTQNLEKDIATPNTRSKIQKSAKKDNSKSDKFKKEPIKLEDIKSSKFDDVKSPKERSTRSKTVKIQGESKKVLYTSSSDEPMKCEICGRQFHLPYNFMIHQKTHQVEEERDFKCDECGSCFKRANVLKKHKETHKKQRFGTHSKGKADSKKEKISPPKAVTGKSKKAVTGKPQTAVTGKPQTAVTGSPQTAVTGSPQKAQSGSLQKAPSGNLQKAPTGRHQKVVTNNTHKVMTLQSIKLETISLDEKLDQICKCNTCGKQFADSASLKIHEAQHLTNMIKCDSCPKSFTTKYDLDRHLELHKKVSRDEKLFAKDLQPKIPKICKNRKIHQCGICEKKFPLAYHLKCHLATHLKDKAYNCRLCRSKFTTNYHFMKHQATHRKLKNKLNTFKIKGKVKVQGRTCPVCGVKIYGTYSYRRHLLIHSKTRRVLTASNNNSNICPPENESKDKISTNIKKQIPEISTPNKNQQAFQSPKSQLKSYECHLCKKQLSRQYNLKRHLEQHHKLVVTSENTPMKSDEVIKANVDITEVRESEMQIHSNGNDGDTEDTIVVIKHKDDDKDKSVAFLGDFSSQGVNIPEGSVITVTADETGEELFKVEVNDLCSQTSESTSVSVTKSNGKTEKSQTSLLCTEVLEVEENLPQNSNSKLDNESKGNQSNENNQSDLEMSSETSNSKENQAGDKAKSTDS